MFTKVAIAFVIALGITSAAMAAPKQRITVRPLVTAPQHDPALARASTQDPTILGWHNPNFTSNWDRNGVRWD